MFYGLNWLQDFLWQYWYTVHLNISTLEPLSCICQLSPDMLTWLLPTELWHQQKFLRKKNVREKTDTRFLCNSSGMVLLIQHMIHFYLDLDMCLLCWRNWVFSIHSSTTKRLQRFLNFCCSANSSWIEWAMIWEAEWEEEHSQICALEKCPMLQPTLFGKVFWPSLWHLQEAGRTSHWRSGSLHLQTRALTMSRSERLGWQGSGLKFVSPS